MSTWNIYHKDGSKLTDVNGEQITVHGLEYSDSWMGECFLTINFKHEVPINFQIGDYIIYRNERFELNYEPGKDKQARPDTYGEGFVYDSVKFNALQDELARAEFLDVVLNDNELHYTALPKFPFYVQTLDDLLDRIQANLDEQIGKGLWKIYSRNMERSVQRGCLASDWLSMYGEGTKDNAIESMSITIDSKTCWEALALVNEKWNVNFIVRGRNIYVGTTGIEAGHIFSYGLGKGLYEIVQNADSDQSVITRLRAYGSEKNLPSHYYADLGVKYVANITKVVTDSTNVELELDVDYIETYFKNKRKYVVSGESQEQSFGWVLQVTFDFQTTITGYVTQSGSSGKCRFYSELKGTQTDTGDEESKEKLDTFISQVKAGNTKMYIMSGLNKKVVPSSMKEYAKNLPNNMSINRLMLPGFPHVSLSDFYDSLTEQEKKYVNPTGKLHKFSTDPYRPYIDSLNIEEIGLRSASQFFDTDDKTNGVIEIYPTIEEMEIGGVRVDEIDEGVAPDDDGRFGDNETVKNVDIYLNKAIDFDINDLKDDDFSISMKDGMCGGRTFKVASSTEVDGRWRLTIERSKDDALELWFPYKDYPIKNGDHFVLSGITLPDSYVKAASLKLLKYAIALLDKNDYTRYVYQPKVDELFMARQHDKAQADETGTIKSLHDTLKAGDLMNFNDTDLNIEGIISIDQLTIKEEDGKIPTYDITLREDKEVGTIQKIQQQISSLQNGNGGTGAGLTTTQVKNQVATEGSKHFISKINDDTAKGTITWEKVQKLLSGLLVGNFNNENGGSWTPDTEGRSHLITDYLEVRMKAIFEELVIKKTSTIGGKEIISPAGGVVAHKVEEVTVTYNNVSQKAYRCYFLAEQEGDAVDNDFAIGDQVRSESFNVRKGTYHKVGNHFYWRLVIGRDEEPVELEGKKYHYIDLSDTDCATASDVPAKGDVLSQCGNRTDVERQNCLIFSAVDTYSPSISLYHGINSYSFANREYVQYGVNKQTNKAFFNVYGDMYVGDRPTKENGYEGSSYIKYDSATKQVSVKGKISAKSTVDGKELSQYIKENSAKGLTEEQVNNLIKNSQVIADLQNQVDGAIETWFYDGVPTLKNAPASSWATDKEKETHLGDLYYDNKTGKAYRFAKDGNTYKWTIITDTDIAKALSDASKAQETADGKMKVFSAQPIPPYQLGDIWVNATYPTDGSIYKNEILRCQTAKAKGSSFAIADWTKASKYTDDSALNTFKEEYKNDMASYKEQLDEKVETWFYNYAPTTQNKPASDWTTDTLKSQHAGDLFYNTSNGYTYRWTGTAWARIKDNDINTAMTAASKAQDTADGKRTVFTSQPTVPYDEGDLWASGGDDGKTLMVCVKSRATGSFTSSEWVKANDSDLNAFAKTIEESLTGIRDQLDKKAETWYQATDPSTSWTTDDAKKEHKGDLWYNTSNNQTFFWNGTKWDKQDVPTEVFDKIDGKSSIYVSKPASYEERDLWILEAAYTLGGVAYSKGELVVATKSNASFSAADWTKKVKYTDDTVANAAKKAAEEAKKAADTAQTNVTNLGKTVTSNKKAFDSYVTDGYLEPSEIAAMAQDSKRLEDAFAAAEKSYNEVKGAEVLKSTKELTDLNTAFTTLSTAKKELITYLSDISTRYNAADTNGKATIVSAVGTKFTNFQSAYSAFYDKLGLANAYITSKIYGDLKQNITDLAGYKYIKDALGQTTDIDGGLVMTTLLALRDADGNVQSGINGAIDQNRGKKSIATWWGGRMVDKDYNSGSLTPATSLIRFDGSGYLANGAIWWDVDGKVHADPTSFIISEKNLGAYLTFFEPTWKAGSDGSSIKDLVALTPQAPFKTLSVSNDLSVEGKLKIGSIILSVVNGALKIDGNVYSTGGMSAYGEGTSNGGGLNGSIVPFDKAKSLTAQNEGTEIASAWSIKKLYDMINSIDVTGQLTDYLKKTEASTLYQPKGNYLTSHQDISGKSDKTHTHSVKINGVTKTIAATGGTAVDLGTYLTSHQSLAAYLKSADAEKTYSKLGHTHAFSEITGKPTTLAGYGVTDGVNAVSVTGNGNAVTSASIDGHTLTLTKGSTFSLSGHTHTFASLTSKPTTIAGYGITDAYTKAQVDSTIAKYLPLAGGTITGVLTVNGIATFKSKVAIGDIYIINDGSGNLYVQKTDGKTAANFYATGGITAYGEGSAGTTGSNNFSAKAYADSIKLTSENLSEIASAYSIAVLNNSLNAAIGRISTLEGGSATSIETTGSGNAVTSVSKSGTKITFTKGSTFSLNGHTHDFITVGATQTITATQYKNNRMSVRPYYNSGGPTTYGNILEVVSGINGGGQLGMEWSGSQTKTDGTDTNVGKLYYRSKRDNMAGWTVWKRLAFAEELAWSYITNKPTTLSGFGITDGLRSVTQPSGSNVFVTGISTSGTAITYTKSYTKKSLSAVGSSGWTSASVDGNIIPDMSFIAYWNGAHTGTYSNLAYCNKGAFGSFAIKNSLAFSELTSKPTTISGYGITDAYTKSQVDAIAAKYLPLTGGTLTGQLKIVASALNGAYNGLLIGDDCYIGDCNFGNTIGLMGVGNNNAGMVKFGKGGMQFGYNGSNHIASTTAQWTNLNADLLDGWHKNNIVWSGAVNSNTANLSHYWAKLFDITVTDNRYDDRSFTFLFSNGYNDTYSVVVLRIRQNGAKDSGAYNFNISLRELVGNMSSRLRVYYNNATGNVQLWGNCQGQYGSLSYTIIKKTGRTSADFTSQGTLVTNTSFSAAQSLPATTGDSPYTLLDGATRIGIVKQADQLVTARSLWGQSFNGTANVSGNMTGVGNINTSAAPAGTIYTNNWFRSKGSTGWYSEDHGGGWYMSDNTWIRNFGSKDVYLSNRLSVNGNVGIGTTAPSHKLHVLGEIYTTTKVNINGIILEKDSNGDLKVNGNLYATGGISAYGASDGTSSSGGLNGSVKSYADALKLTSESLSEIASAYSIKQLSIRITSLEGGSATSISVSGGGNAVTSVTKNGTTISVVKGSTFLTAHQSLAGYMKTATADAKYMYHSRNNIVSDLNSFATNSAVHIYEMNNVTNRPNSNSWVQVMNWGTGDSTYGFLLANDYSTNGHMYFRQKIAGSWKDWKTIIDSSNIGSQSVNYAASAGSVAWTNVSGRPSTMKNPSALSWSGYSSGSYDGSAAKSISIPNNTNQLTNGAGFITSSASITGNAGSATKLQTTRTLWGQSFNGTANISGSMTGVGDMTLDAGARIKHGSGNLYIGNSDNSNWIGVQDICSQSSIGDGNWSLRTSGAAHFKDTTINGTATIKNLLSLVDGSHKGLKMGSTYISSLDGEVILQGNTALRFGNDAWDYNQWAGLKYDHSSKTVYLGIADGSIFKANSAQSGGVINLKQGISSVYTPALYAGGDIYHTGVYRMLWKNSKASTYLNVMNITQDDNGILTIGYGNFANNKNVVLEGHNLNFRVGNDSGMKSMWLNYNNGNPVLSLDGNFYATGGVTAYKSSDERLKHDIHGVDSLAIIKAMGGTVAFRYNADNKDSIGWIAQRVLHNTFMQDLVEKDDKGFLKINYWSPKLIAVAFGAIEQVDDEVSRLKRRVRDLENEVEQLKSDRL